MNRIGSSAIGGITAMAVTVGPKVARTGGNAPSTSPTSNGGQRGDPQPHAEPAQAGQRIGPEQILARQRIGLEHQRRHRLDHRGRQRQDLVGQGWRRGGSRQR